MEPPDPREHQDPWDQQDQQDQPVIRDRTANKDQTVIQVQLGPSDLSALRDHKVRWVPSDHKELPDQRDQLVQQVQRGRMANRAQTEGQDP